MDGGRLSGAQSDSASPAASQRIHGYGELGVQGYTRDIPTPKIDSCLAASGGR